VYDVGDLNDALPDVPVASAIAALVSSGTAPDAMLITATYDGRDIAGRLSVKLDRPVLTNVAGLVVGDGLSSQHQVFGGNKIVTARFTGDGPGIFVVRAKSFAAEPAGGAPAEVVPIAVPGGAGTQGARVVARHLEASTGPKLDDAAVVVSGGRGLGSADAYALIEELARLLHGAAGASRAIVDAGWVPYSHQVGQTGKTVKPTVYLACGISGATQHLVGMKSAKNIVAVNKDHDAPIFSIADLGVVGDVHKILPALIEELKARS
jgi:electron transfer flavoprotein alpha subunit